jgi:SAM-dependent methyltransferase
MSDYNKFGKDYFKSRSGNDPLRNLSFLREKNYILSFLGPNVFESGILLDVGCSTGEFIDAIGWTKDHAFGMEISDYARSIAADKGIRFKKNLLNTDNFFDLVVFRGTIQYFLNPFEYIQRAFACLKPGGHVVFLATPNSNSPYYCLFNTLPFLEEKLNYLIPSDVSLAMNLRNAGFEIIDIDYPYIGTPYASPISDHLRFLRKLIFKTEDKFPFWRSVMSIVARKSSNI